MLTTELEQLQKIIEERDVSLARLRETAKTAEEARADAVRLTSGGSQAG